MTLRLRVQLSPNDLGKYPFLPEAIERIRELGITLNDLVSPLLQEVVRRAEEYVRAAIHARDLPPIAEDCDVEILTFMSTLVLLRLIYDKILIRRFAVAFSKRFGAILSNEETDKVIYILSKLGIKVRVLNDGVHGYNLSVNFIDYVENIPESRGAWKLVHRLVNAGWVLVNKLEAVRLGEEALKKALERRVESLRLEDASIPDGLFTLAESLSKEWSLKLKELKESWAPVSAPDRERRFPPCIVSIIENLKAGKNIPHSARFALASFLLNIGMSVDEVLEVFRSAPDFNEKIARYQVEHIAGLRGSGKKYTTYKCDNMRALGLCVADCGVRHPLQYYWSALRSRRG